MLFEEVVTPKYNVEIDFQKSCTKCRVSKTKSWAEPILNLVLGKVFSFEVPFIGQVIAYEAFYWKDSKYSWNDLSYAWSKITSW